MSAANTPPALSVPALVSGALLWLVALSQPLLALGGGVGVLVWMALARRAGRPLGAPALVACSCAGAAVAALLVGREVEPMGSLIRDAASLARHVAAAGVVFGGALVGGGAVLLLHGAGHGSPHLAATPAPARRWRRRAGTLLRPFRLVGLLGLLASAPVLSTRLEGGAADGRREMTEALLQISWHQEEHHRAYGAFAVDGRRLRGWRPPPVATVTIEAASATTWRARARHPGFTTTCVMEGTAAAGRVREPSPPLCQEDRRWFR